MTRSWRVLVGAAFIAIVVIMALTVVSRRAPRFVAAPRSRPQTARAELFAEIQPVHVTNCELLRFGEAHDGGYPLCRNLLRRVKAGYSYGISGYDGWGCSVSRRLHIRVHQYDCFELREPSCPGGDTVFHGECIGTTRETQDDRPFDTMANQFKRNGDAVTPLVMKIDVERRRMGFVPFRARQRVLADRSARRRIPSRRRSEVRRGYSSVKAVLLRCSSALQQLQLRSFARAISLVGV
jgi:hypothetical protein